MQKYLLVLLLALPNALSAQVQVQPGASVILREYLATADQTNNKSAQEYLVNIAADAHGNSDGIVTEQEAADYVAAMSNYAAQIVTPVTAEAGTTDEYIEFGGVRVNVSELRRIEAMVTVPGGTFMMGASSEEAKSSQDRLRHLEGVIT